MKLSEAIRKGCEMVPGQSYSTFFSGTKETKVVSACVIGTAVIALTGLRDRNELYELKHELVGKTRGASFFQMLEFYFTENFSSKRIEKFSLESYLVYCNDTLKLTREKIADNLEELGL